MAVAGNVESMRRPPDFRAGIRPIFIIGAPRSGTSIMTWALGRHPNIQTMEETNWLSAMAVGAGISHALGSSRGLRTHLSNSEYPLDAFLRRLGEFAHDVVNDAFQERVRRFYGNSVEEGELRLGADFNPKLPLLARADDPKRRWVDGTPLNTHFAWALSRMFPEAQFIHQLRRPADVASSLQGFDRLGVAARPLAAGLQEWTHHVDSAARLEQALGAARVFRLRFERIRDDRESVLRDLFEFLGEEYCSECLETLDQTLNSSAVEERRQANAETMLDMPEYLEASSLYWRLQDLLPGSPDPDADATLQSRFRDYCAERSLP